MCDYYQITGGRRLSGEYIVPAAKNAVLPMLAACLMCDGRVNLSNCPDLSDIAHMLDILRGMGGEGAFRDGVISVDMRNAVGGEIPKHLAESMRSSVFLLGPMLARFGQAKLYLPGGCKIGKRPIDLHISGLEKLGVAVTEGEEYIECDAQNARACDIYMEYKSVGATENLVMFALSLRGVTTLYNCAREPEVGDLCSFLCAAGAKIDNKGSVIRIEGGRLRGCDYSPIGDRIVAGTLETAVVAVGGEILLRGIKGQHLESFHGKIPKSCCKIKCFNGNIYLKSHSCLSDIAAVVQTAPYPLFPTDLQSVMMTLMSVAPGERYIVENVFENRLGLASQLADFGADICVCENIARICGVPRLQGSITEARDLRGGAALLVAALTAEGVSRIYGIEHILRGYDSPDAIFAALGADIIKYCKQRE